MNEIIKKEIFNVNEISDYLHVSKSSIRKLIRENKIPYYRVLSRIFFEKEKIDMWINNQQLNNLNDTLLVPPNYGGGKSV